jgi:hypothetical protein
MEYDELLEHLDDLVALIRDERFEAAACYLQMAAADLRGRRRFFDTRSQLVVLPPARTRRFLSAARRPKDA